MTAVPINESVPVIKGLNLTYKELREAVFKRDSNTCQLCKGNSRVGFLHCHHIIPNGPADMKNLITLCEFCHDKVHLFLSKKGYRYAKGYIRNW